MEFCEKCRGLIVVRDEKAVCASCGRKVGKKPRLKVSEKMEEKGKVAVVKDKDEIHPIVEIKCPKCKSKKAYFWTMQTRSSDEAETKFYRCTECEHTWRVYK